MRAPLIRACAAIGLAFALMAAPAVRAEPGPSLTPVVTTNYVIVTNVVLVTNYVQTSRMTAASATNSALPDVNWVPPADRFDWIQLKSGEWLKGRIKAMQDRELEFDSEELDDLIFNWTDIRQVRSPHTQDVLFISGELVSGPVTVTPDKVTVGDTNTTAFARDQLQSLARDGSKEWNLWSGKASIGLTLRSGNTESVDYTAQAYLQRRTPATRLTLDYIGNVSSQDNVESANNNRVGVEFDLWLSRQLYLVLPYAEYYVDPFQNLSSRTTLGVGVGYDLINRPKLEWNITAGPAFQYTVYESVQPGVAPKTGTPALWFGTKFDWDITKRIELILEYSGQYTSPEAGDTTHHSVSTLSLEITKRLDLDVSFTWDRVTQPKAGADGTQPQPDDFRLVVGLGVDF